MRFATYMLTGLLALGILSSCSLSKKDGPFTINKIEVSITNDESLIGGTEAKDKNGKQKQITPNALYYSIRSHQNGYNKLYQRTADELDIKFFPNDSLKQAAKENVGYNIFEQMKEGLGKGMSIQDFDDKGMSEISFYYELGATEENDSLPLSPSKEKLAELKKKARDGEMVLYRNHKEIARYDLKTLKSVTNTTE